MTGKTDLNRLHRPYRPIERRGETSAIMGGLSGEVAVQRSVGRLKCTLPG